MPTTAKQQDVAAVVVHQITAPVATSSGEGLVQIETDPGKLQAIADAKKRDAVLTALLDRADFSFDAARAKAARNQDPMKGRQALHKVNFAGDL